MTEEVRKNREKMLQKRREQQIQDKESLDRKKRSAVNKILNNPAAFRSFCRLVSGLHSFSYDNLLVIYVQNENAIRLAGKMAWKMAEKRDVRDDEKPILVYHRSVQYKNPGTLAESDDGYGLIMENGHLAYDKEPEFSENVYAVPVYDISQTIEEGKDEDSDPGLADLLTGGQNIASVTIDIEKRIGELGYKITWLDRLPDDMARNGMYDAQERRMYVKDKPVGASKEEALLEAYVDSIFKGCNYHELTPGSPEMEYTPIPDTVAKLVVMYALPALGHHANWEMTGAHFQELRKLEKEDGEEVLKRFCLLVQRVVQTMHCGYPLTFDETMIVTNLLPTSKLVSPHIHQKLELVYSRIDTEHGLSDEAVEAISRLFERIREMSEGDLEELILDVLEKRVFSSPAIELWCEGDGTSAGAIWGGKADSDRSIDPMEAYSAAQDEVFQSSFIE